jgi:hypothetical protein
LAQVGIATLAAAATGQALAQETGWQVTASVQQRTVLERSSSGAGLVSERGEMARFSAARSFSSVPAIEAHAAIAQGRLRYSGRTQAGAPLSTHTEHTDLEAGVLWRPWGPSAWGEVGTGVDLLRNRRSIAAAGGVGGLVETSTWLMPVVDWRSSEFALGGFTLQARGRLRTSAYEHLLVDFGGVYDSASLSSAARRDAELGLEAWRTAGWRWGITWRRATQRATPDVPLFVNGTPVGTVSQPRLRVEDVQLQVTRSF